MKTTKDPGPPYAPCEACGIPVLRATTPKGQRVVLEVQRQTYMVVWPNEARVPLAHEAGGYPVHTCPRQESSRALSSVRDGNADATLETTRERCAGT